MGTWRTHLDGPPPHLTTPEPAHVDHRLPAHRKAGWRRLLCAVCEQYTQHHGVVIGRYGNMHRHVNMFDATTSAVWFGSAAAQTAQRGAACRETFTRGRTRRG